MPDFYQPPDQRLYMVDEATYGEYYDPQSEHSAWQAILETFPHIMAVNVAVDSFDYELPKILKEKIYAIGGGKHASIIVNTIQEPVEFSFETKMQHPVFLTYAVGAVASTGTRAEISTITCLAKASCVQDSYFILNGIDASGEEHFAIWIDVSGAGTKPVIAGINADHVLQADINADTTATQVATTVAAAIDADAAFGAAGVAEIVTITNAANGAVRDVRDSGIVASGFSFANTQQGVNTHTITENTGYDLPSFTFHIEQRNATPSVLSTSDDGYTVVSSKSFKDDNATFQTDTVAVGDTLWIQEDTHIGKYFIGSIVSETEITVVTPDNFTSTTALDYKITDSEDIIVDLFGCVISEYELSVDYGDKIVKESVTIKTVNFALGNRLLNAPNYVELIDPHTWANLKEASSNYLLMEGTTDKTPDIVNKASLKISNEIDFQPEIEYRHAAYALCGKKEVSLNLVGYSKNRDTWDYYKGYWDNVNQRYSIASGKLNTKFRLERDATYDYMLLSVYNWLLDEHNQHVFNISDRIKGIDFTLTDATPDSNLRIIDSFSIVDILSDTCYQNSFS